jgi:heat shock protein HslJ
LGAPAATRLACGYARERFDRQYWRLLQASPAYRVDANVLTLTAGADSVRFKPAADAR